MSQIQRRADDSEIIQYSGQGISMYVKTDSRLSTFPNRRMLAHWHDDIEYIRVWEGRMAYHVDAVELLLGTGQALVVNSRHLHYAHADPMDSDAECVYAAMRFQPEMLTSDIYLRTSYIDPVINANTSYLLLDAQNPICQALDEAARLYEEKAPASELRVLGQLNQAWALLYEWMQENHGAGTPDHADPDVAVQKQMADYIYHNYTHRISLTEVAQAGGVCKSKCCQIFKKYLRKTPGEFLMAYRLEAAAHMLRTTAQSVTEIAYACGFNSPSYFTEAFRRENGCTPRMFRQQSR